ncbi:hypothetical protein ACOMHN_057214 [Nucella lapillus]
MVRGSQGRWMTCEVRLTDCSSLCLSVCGSRGMCLFMMDCGARGSEVSGDRSSASWASAYLCVGRTQPLSESGSGGLPQLVMALR